MQSKNTRVQKNFEEFQYFVDLKQQPQRLAAQDVFLQSFAFLNSRGKGAAEQHCVR